MANPTWRHTCVLSLSRVLAKARASIMLCESAGATRLLPKESYDEAEALFHTIAAEMLACMRARGAPTLAEMDKMTKLMTIDGEHNWNKASRNKFPRVDRHRVANYDEDH